MKKIVKRLFVLVLVLAAAGAVVAGVLYAKANAADEAPAEQQTDLRVAVVCSEIREMVFEDRIAISGNIEARNTAMVSARIPGTLDSIYVDEGDDVLAGKTRLFQTDKIKLEKALESATQQVAVSAAAVKARQATVARIEADLAKVKIDYDRYKRLFEKDRAITRSALEAQDSRLKQTIAAVAEASAGVELAQRQSDQAASALAIARKDLADSLVLAPIGGKVSRRILEPGEMAEAGTPVMRIDDLSQVEIAVYLPEAYYARIIPGKTMLRGRVDSVDIAAAPITYKSPTIHPKLRTFEIKVLLEDPPQGVVPGAMADVVVVLERRKGLGVPRQSIQRRSKGLAVFTISKDLAHLNPVEVGLENDGWIEITGEGLSAGTRVVRLGQEQLSNDMAVKEVREDGK